MDNESKLAALIRLRKQMLDHPDDTNLTTPEEMAAMPPELQDIIKQKSMEKLDWTRVPIKENLYTNTETANAMMDDIDSEETSERGRKFHEEGNALDYALDDRLDPAFGKNMPYLNPDRFKAIKNLLKSKK